MTTHQQKQQADQQRARGKQRMRLPRGAMVIIIVLVFAAAIIITWILSYLNVIPSFLASIFTFIITVLGVVFAFFQLMHMFIPFDKREPFETSPRPGEKTSIPIVSATASTSSEAPSYRGIVGLPPPTHPRTIQQRDKVVREVYSTLLQPDITAIALTGIGGAGKSTLAALVYRYAEEQRQASIPPFFAGVLWLTIDSTVTFADLLGNLFESLGKPLPDLSNLAPQNQAVILFNALNSVDEALLVILDQFENLLDWETGRALTDRPGIGEWLDLLNGQQCRCRILLTSRPRPIGTRKYPPTYLQEYPVQGLEMAEGIALLRNRAVIGAEEELRTAVERCEGHAFSLTLLASLIHDHNISLTTLFKDSTLWIGDIAHNLLDYIFTKQLNPVQRELIRAFSVYREPVSIDAAQMIMGGVPRLQMSSALKALRVQYLIEAPRKDRYQLHAIVAGYVQGHFNGESEEANQEALKVAHMKAAQYYRQQAATSCPPIEKRQQLSDLHDLIETVWQLCQAGEWEEAFDLMEQENIFADLRRQGGNAILLELYLLLLPIEKWHPASEQAAHLYDNLGEVHRVLGQMETASKYLEQALRLCQGADNRKEEGWILTHLGRVFYEQGEESRAEEYLERALKIHRGSEDRAGEAMTLNYLGRAYDRLEQMGRGLKCYQEALRIYQEIGDRGGEGWVLTSLGSLYNTIVPSRAQKERALYYCEKGLRILREVGDREKIAWALTYLGRAYNALGQYKQAYQHYEEALQVHQEVGNRRGEAWTLYNLGKNFVDSGEGEQALKCYEQAISIQREIRDRWNGGATLNQLGWLFLNMGQLEAAQAYYEQALLIRSEVGDRLGEGRTLKNLARVYLSLGRIEEATRCIERAWRINKGIGDHEGEARTLEVLGLLSLQQVHGNTERSQRVALASFVMAQRIFEEIQSPFGGETRRQIEELQKLLGFERFAAFLAQVQPQAQQIVGQALGEKMQ